MSALYENVREAGDFVFVAGQTALVPSGDVPTEVGEQVAVVVGRIADLLAERGLRLNDVVKMTYFLTDIADLAQVRAALDAALPSPRPAASLVAVHALVDPRLRIEIEAVAHRSAGN